jgi:isoprenylcysteine carboxyl methyltransferase (ICMT) family protein YpbQ
MLLTAPVMALGLGRSVVRAQGIVVVVAMIVLALVESISRKRPETVRSGAPGVRLALASGLALLVTAWLAIASSVRTEWAWIGLPLVACGIALRAAAMRALGDAFSSETVIVPGRAIVAGRLRHPSEVGLVAIAAGIAILGASEAAAIVVVVAVIPMSIARIRAENAALVAARPLCYGARDAARARPSSRDRGVRYVGARRRAA